MPGEGLLPADLIMGEHYRLGSSMAILSRSFCDKDSFRDPDAVRARFDLGMKKIRDYECFLSAQNEDFFRKNLCTPLRLTCLPLYLHICRYKLIISSCPRKVNIIL